MKNTIYKITNLINGKVYIGKTALTIEQRFKQHLKDSLKEEQKIRPLYKAINKYGKENFIIETVETDISDEQISKKEIYYIKKFNSYVGFQDSNGYDATLGGDGKKYKIYNLEDLISKYKELQCISEVARLFNLDNTYVSKLLKANNIEIIPFQEVEKKRYGTVVYQLDPKSYKIINIFDSINDAKRYLKLNKTNGHLKDVIHSNKHFGYDFLWYTKEDYEKTFNN